MSITAFIYRLTEGWLSGLKRRFAKPLYGIKACTEGSNPSPSATSKTPIKTPVCALLIVCLAFRITLPHNKCASVRQRPEGDLSHDSTTGWNVQNPAGRSSFWRGLAQRGDRQ